MIKVIHFKAAMGVSEAHFTKFINLLPLALLQWHKVYEFSEDELHRPPWWPLIYFNNAVTFKL